MKIVIIAAVARNRVIGRSSGEMPWHSKEDFQHFKKTTLGYPVIMGRKTFDSLGRKPLKARLNIVITRQQEFRNDGVTAAGSLDEAIDLCRNENSEKIFLIGGGYIFAEAMKIADEMILSMMDFDAEGDVLFPEINENEWVIVSRDKREGFEILYYERRNK